MKLILQLTLVVFFFTFAKAQNSQVEEPVPTGLFSVTFWGKPTTRTLLYSPWGNFEDANSTKSSVRVAYGMLSQKCAFYGQGNLVFYGKRNYSELELDLLQDKKDADNSSFFAQVPFSASVGETKEFIVLLTPSNENGNYKAYAVPFGKNEIPWGTYKVFSRYSKTLYMAAEKKTYTLSPGKSLLLNSSDFENLARVKLLFYEKEKGKYKEVTSQNFVVGDKQRGIFFLANKRNRAYVIPMTESQRPLQRSIGYGKPPTDLLPPRNSNLDLSPLNNI